MSILFDHYGHEIKPGARVAFNLSGTVRFGTVTAIGKTRSEEPVPWSGYVRRNIKVREQGASVDSRVNSTDNLVVLPKTEAEERAEKRALLIADLSTLPDIGMLCEQVGCRRPGVWMHAEMGDAVLCVEHEADHRLERRLGV